MIDTTQSTRTWRPVVTYGLIAANLIAYAWTASVSHSLVDNQASLTFAKLCLSLPATASGWWWTAVTSGFLHFGPVHLLVNMYSLFVLGRVVEAVLGRARFSALYAVSLLGGSATVLWFAIGGGLTAGASGAIFGLMGADLVLALRMRVNPANILVVIGVNIVISFSVPGISLVGHLGGLVAGALATAGIVYGPQVLPRAARTRARVESVGWVALGVVAAIAVVAVAARFGDLHDAVIYSAA